MRAYAHLRRWVDEMQTGGLGEGKLVYLIGVIPMFLVPLIGNWWWVPASVFGVVWLSFVTWRLWVIAKTGLIDAESSHFRNDNNG